jgi:hypothetical protein
LNISTEERKQVVELLPLVEVGNRTAVISLSPAAARPVGFVEGLPGSQCGVAVDGLKTEIKKTEGGKVVSFALLRLPPGRLMYQASRRAPLVALKETTVALDYDVPQECLVCGAR